MGFGAEGPGKNSMKRAKLIHSSGLVCILIVAALATWWLVLPSPVRGQQDEAPIMGESKAVALALDKAASAGLEGPASGMVARQMTLKEDTELTSWGVGPDGPTVGLYPDRPVWVVSMWGHIVNTGPGNPGTPGIPRKREIYDSLTIVFYATTGKSISRHATYPGNGAPILLSR